jgi:hypothetical protein
MRYYFATNLKFYVVKYVSITENLQILQERKYFYNMFERLSQPQHDDLADYRELLGIKPEECRQSNSAQEKVEVIIFVKI